MIFERWITLALPKVLDAGLVDFVNLFSRQSKIKGPQSFRSELENTKVEKYAFKTGITDTAWIRIFLFDWLIGFKGISTSTIFP